MFLSDWKVYNDAWIVNIYVECFSINFIYVVGVDVNDLYQSFGYAGSKKT